MSRIIISKRYAKALLDLSNNEASAAKQKLGMLNTVAELFKLDESKKILISPIMPNVLKKQLLEYALGKAGKDQELSHFLNIIVDAKRVEILPDIIEEFSSLIDELEGKVKVEIESAMELDSAIAESILSTLKKETGSEVSMSIKVSPSLLGGFVVNMGNRRLDLSLTTRLEEISANAVV